MLGREALLAAATPAVKVVEVPGLGTVGLRKLSIAAQQEWAKSADEIGRGDLGMAHLIIACLVDEHAKPVFEPDETQLILGLDATIVTALFREIIEHNALAPVALDTAVKN